MKQIAFFMAVLCVAQVFGQNPELSIASPGADNTLYYSNVQNQNDVSQSRGLHMNEVGITLGQDFPSGDNPHMYLEGRLGLRRGKHLWVLAYGHSNSWDFGVGESSNIGNTNILSGSYGQSLEIFEGFSTQAYLGVSYLRQKTSDGDQFYWGLPLTLVVNKPIFRSISLGLVGQLQATTKKGRAMIGLKLSYDLIP